MRTTGPNLAVASQKKPSIHIKGKENSEKKVILS